MLCWRQTSQMGASPLLGLLQDGDDLLVGELALLHTSILPFGWILTSQMVQFSGERSIAGCVASHTVSSMFDPAWALPLTAFLCWVVASYPVSLFRFLREHRRQTAASTLSPTSKRSPLAVGILSRPAHPAPHACSPRLVNLKHPVHFSGDMQAHWASGKEARVPLIKRGSRLYVKAWFNGQEELCQIDTGAASVEWPRDLHFKGHLTSWHRQGVTC